MIKHPWHTKSANNQYSIRKASAPGELISVDQMEYSTPVFISQLRGNPTKQRYCETTIFLYHYGDLTYVHLQKGFSSHKIVQEKEDFEDYARTYKVDIKHYHAANVRFVDNIFLHVVAQENQTISYCRVNAHFQNGKSKKCIRNFQEQKGKIFIT